MLIYKRDLRIKIGTFFFLFWKWLIKAGIGIELGRYAELVVKNVPKEKTQVDLAKKKKTPKCIVKEKEAKIHHLSDL